MQGTYPLFVSNPARIASALGALCRPIEEQLLDANIARVAMDREVHAQSGQGPVFVTSRTPRWFELRATRVRRQEAAWDAARAALKTDIGRNFCDHDPQMVDKAWAASGMPERGKPITLRQVVRLARLADYLYAFHQGRICDGQAAKYQEAEAKLRIALALYRPHADRPRPSDRGEAFDPIDPLPDLAARAWTHLQESRGKGAVKAVEEALAEMSPARPAPPVPVAGDAPDAQDFGVDRPDRKYR